MAEKIETEKSRFDWVTERSNCTLPKIFNSLRIQVEQDVKTRNAMRPDLAPYEFVMEEDVNEFKVSLEARGRVKAVKFAIDDHLIVVLDQDNSQLFDITLIFTDDGKCRIKAKEEACELWQVRRMALEDLMFRTL
jgi:hypothetical protein